MHNQWYTSCDDYTWNVIVSTSNEEYVNIPNQELIKLHWTFWLKALNIIWSTDLRGTNTVLHSIFSNFWEMIRLNNLVLGDIFTAKSSTYNYEFLFTNFPEKLEGCKMGHRNREGMSLSSPSSSKNNFQFEIFLLKITISLRMAEKWNRKYLRNL